MSNTKLQPPATRNILKMSLSEVIQLFAWYDFKDNLGHELVNCQDFIELVELAVSSGTKDDVRNQTQVSV